jgi:signal transduction histidine kinase
MNRLERLTTDLADIARYGQTPDEPARCDFDEVVRHGWDQAAHDGMSLAIDGDGPVHGEGPHLVDLFCNLFEFANAIDSTAVSVSKDGADIVVETDGDSLSNEEIEAAFTYGEAVPSTETNMLLPMARAICRAHGWSVDVDSGNGVTVRIATA